MKPEPLKCKRIWEKHSDYNKVTYLEEDVKAAVEWLKESFTKTGDEGWCKLVNKKIEGAFPDLFTEEKE